MLFVAATRTYHFDLSAYPDWVLVLGGTLVAALFLWITIKLMKWALWLLLFAVLGGGLAWSMLLLIR